MFPLRAREFSLSFAQVGLLKTSYSGAMSLFQIPAGLLAERWGEARLLAGGTLVCALGFLALGKVTQSQEAPWGNSFVERRQSGLASFGP